MPFADIKQRESNSTFRKIEFIKLSAGMHTIRILEDHPLSVDVHYVSGMNVQCLGNECPVCRDNRKIIMENPQDFRNIKGYAPRRQTFILNVLDRTPAKICPSEACKEEVKAINGVFPPQCPKCGALITAVKASPLNKVKILAKGVELFSKLNAFEVAVNDAEGNPLPLTKYDIMLSVSGNKKESPTPIPNSNATDVIEIPEDQFFERERVAVKLTAEEIGELQRGVALRDIFLARKAEENADANVKDVRDTVSKDIQDKIDALYDA